MGLADPLNGYWVRNYRKLFGVPVEQAVVSLDNPHVVGRHVLCASDELRVDGEGDTRWFGPLLGPWLRDVAEKSDVRQGSGGWVCPGGCPRPSGWRWTPSGTARWR